MSAERIKAAADAMEGWEWEQVSDQCLHFWRVSQTRASSPCYVSLLGILESGCDPDYIRAELRGK